MPPPPEKCGFRLYKEVLNDPKCIVAPMVDASELAWRMLARRYNADLCYTPMWHSAVFARDEKYRRNALQTCPQDRPLIVQFCANDPETFKKAVQLTIDTIECDAIDLNLGCPQVIAKRYTTRNCQMCHDLLYAYISEGISVPSCRMTGN